jgi:DNA-binding NarL/FixJ family response regulator
MRVALAEDDLVYRNGLVRLLEAAEVTVLHAAAGGDQLLAYLNGLEPGDGMPDVVMLDIRMGGRDDEGLLTADKITASHPEVGILMLSAHVQASYAQRLFTTGSAGRGYLLKDSLDSVAELSQALSRVRRGGTYTDPRVVDELIRREPQDRLDALLSPREQEVLALVATGASNAAIARRVRVGIKSIEATISSLYAKLGVADAPEYNRRVLVVLNWLDLRGEPGGLRTPPATPR